MSQLNQKLSDAASQNRDLLHVLSQTDYAVPSSKQNAEYIADLKSQIATTDKELRALHSTTEDERKDHVKYRDSVVRRFGHKLGGQKGKDKWSAKEDKEEREFLEAWQKEREAKERREYLGQALENAENDKRNLDADKARHDQAQTELDQMYHAIFSGPTPEVPGEDQQEDGVNQALNIFQQSQTRLGTEKQAVEALNRARDQLSRGLQNMAEAHDMSNMDRFGGGAFTDMMERDALSKAQVDLTNTLRAMDEARRAQPAIPALSDVNIDNGHMLSDVLFDNIFSDMAQHDRIKNSEAQMVKARDQLENSHQEQLQRMRDAQSQLEQASNQLDAARKELQRIRSEAFERMAGGVDSWEGNSDPPPAY